MKLKGIILIIINLEISKINCEKFLLRTDASILEDARLDTVSVIVCFLL